MSRVSVTLGAEVLEAVEAVRQGLRPKPSVSATVAMLVEDGLRARAKGTREEARRGYVARLERAIGKAEREAASREDERGHYCEGQAAGLRAALRLLGEGGA